MNLLIWMQCNFCRSK